MRAFIVLLLSTSIAACTAPRPKQTPLSGGIFTYAAPVR
jgi:hypothetical protein